MMQEDKAKDTVILRGICATIDKMGMPTFDNLKELLSKFGYTLTKK